MLRIVFLALGIAALAGAKEDPVQWTLMPVNGSGQVPPGSAVFLQLKAVVEPGWHLYSPTTQGVPARAGSKARSEFRRRYGNLYGNGHVSLGSNVQPLRGGFRFV